MAIVFINSALPDQSALWWMTDQGEVAWKETGKARELLADIAKHREVLGNEIRAVAVVAGPGRFSSLRVGILYAHVLARWYKVPLYALSLADIETPVTRADAFHAMMGGARDSQSYVAPIYDREPNITTPRV